MNGDESKEQMEEEEEEEEEERGVLMGGQTLIFVDAVVPSSSPVPVSHLLHPPPCQPRPTPVSDPFPLPLPPFQFLPALPPQACLNNARTVRLSDNAPFPNDTPLLKVNNTGRVVTAGGGGGLGKGGRRRGGGGGINEEDVEDEEEEVEVKEKERVEKEER
ncbi:hypothetical protein Pmani_015077 [Petrolisthes manimaculis]|uniref:Uncharacterized protein n=1 Tax=Petrolisthes manimaculis TaxID=1843537 RepID=A0AAE1PSY0_9EUCA|nr:hypothetical protein Pmani_015077 [Petrolisthes manimaculis]